MEEHSISQQQSTKAAPALLVTSSSNSYAAVIENRAKEVGVAVLYLDSLKLQVSQFIEAGRSYTTTQLLLDACTPRQVVLVASQHHEVSGGVNSAVAAGWDHVLLPRSCFDDTKGILSVQELTGWSASSTTAGPSTGSDAGSSLVLHKSHYLGFGAAGALLHHLKHDLRLALAPKSFQVEFEGIKHHMRLDRDVVVSLDLLAPSKSRAALQKYVANTVKNHKQHAASGDMGTAADSRDRGSSRAGGRWQQQVQAASASKRCSSLFGFLDYTSTSCGARLLRTNLLQPLTDINTLQLRLDGVQELLESPHLTLELVSLTETLPKNLDTVCSNLAIRPAEGGSKDMSLQLGRLISSVILLRDVLRIVPVMADSMAWVDSALLKAIRVNLGSDELQQLLSELEAVLDDDAQVSKTQFVNKVQQCFAVRAQVDSLLDISRSTFNQLTDAIHELAAQYRTSTGIPGLKVQYSSSKGFYLMVPSQHIASAAAGAGTTAGGTTGVPPSAASEVEGEEHPVGGQVLAGAGSRRQWEPQRSVPQLPKFFLVLEKRGRLSSSVTTHELNALNSRLRDAAADCIMLTVQVLEQLVSKLLAQMPLLLRMLDNIALLDMLLSFFQAVTGTDGDWCQPELCPSGPLAITQGRHPLLQAMYAQHSGSACSSSCECVANDSYISPAATLHLVTGPNMSGKSTYLKQVALLVILAQIGCYVPATLMVISPYDSLFTRVGTADSIENNASSFMVEMADMAHLMDRAGPHSLVIIDELGRATSTSDGVALCWAVSEYLLAMGAHTLLATHFRQLGDLAAMYPCAKLWQMQVAVSTSDIDFKWSISPQLPMAVLSTAAAAAGEAPAAAEVEAASHYGIMLARMAGLPPAITGAALDVAGQLDSKQRQLQLQQGHDSSMQQLQHVYSLVHKLGCVAREAAAGGLLGVDAAGQPSGVAIPQVLGSDHTGAALSPAGNDSGAADAGLSMCRQLMQELKSKAEKLLLGAAGDMCAAESCCGDH